MDLSCTPRARFSRRKFTSPSTAAPYRSPLMHSLPEKKVQSPSASIPDELKTPKLTLDDKNEIFKETVHEMQQKSASPVATFSPFRSPFSHSISLQRKAQLPSESMSLDELKSSTIHLWEKNKVFEEKIHHLEQKGLKEEELKWYIDKLHRYNEIKDIAQTVMGRLAIMEQKTIKEIHEDFGMTEND